MRILHFQAILLLIFHLTTRSETLSQDKGILIVVLSQQNAYHVKKAQDFRQHIQQQVEETGINSVSIDIQFSHVDHDVVGAWTIIPILQRITLNQAEWVFFCEDVTRVNLNAFLKVFRRFSPEKEWFLGHALKDQEATIIHHFAFHENPAAFSYPSFASGFALSKRLLSRLSSASSQWKNMNAFSIDPKHEFALYIQESTKGIELTNVPEFCVIIDSSEKCATYVSQVFPSCPSANSEDFFVAVKTYSAFYNTRVQVTQNTWAPFVKNLMYFGDVENSTIPVKALGVPNTKSGHCLKTFSIMKYFLRDLPKYRWLVIVDDDTIVSISRLERLLNCYNSKDPVALGERYGFQTTSSTGYDYITGGSGMVFSYETVKKMVESDECKCPKIDSPDDMIIGICLKRLNLAITHSSSFHQARPSDYSKEYLSSHIPLSFHKHWSIDPIEVYNSWFRSDDEKMRLDEVYKHQDEL